MTQKQMVLAAVENLPADRSFDKIADRIEFLAAGQKGFAELDRGEGIPHEEIKKQFAAW